MEKLEDIDVLALPRGNEVNEALSLFFAFFFRFLLLFFALLSGRYISCGNVHATWGGRLFSFSIHLSSDGVERFP